MKDVHKLIPRSKRDLKRARAAVAAGYPAVEPILGELIAWLKDRNWPVVGILDPFLQTVGAPLAPHIRHVLATDDRKWKERVIERLIPALPPEAAAEFRSELDQMCYESVPVEKHDELVEAACHALIHFDWLRPGRRAELMRTLEERFLPRVNQCADQLRAAHPDCSICVRSSPIGSGTSFQAHELTIECILPNIPRDGADNVALTITFSHLDRDARLSADVYWGNPAAETELEFREDWTGSEQWPLATPEAIAELEAFLPALFDALRAALNRRRPP